MPGRIKFITPFQDGHVGFVNLRQPIVGSWTARNVQWHKESKTNHSLFHQGSPDTAKLRKTFAKEGQQSTVFAWVLIAQTNNAGLIYMQGQVIQLNK